MFLGSVPLAAQYAVPVQSSFGVASGLQSSQGSTPQSVTVLTSPPQTSGCPVSLRAEHKADGTMVQAGDQTRGTHPKGHAGIGQWLHLTLANPKGKKVTAALITVFGFSDKARMTQTSGNGADARRTITVPFSTVPLSGAAPATAEADVWVPYMTAVQSIEIHSVTFDDGAVWSFAGKAGCHIMPDPLMLIAGR
jgi:hypothetical protein